MPRLNPNDVTVWVEVAGQLVKLVKTSIEEVREFFEAQDTTEADLAQLRKVNELYGPAIAKADAAARGEDDRTR